MRCRGHYLDSTWGEGETEELSIWREKLSTGGGVVLGLSFRKFEAHQDLILERQEVKEEGGRLEFGLQERLCWVEQWK